MRDRSILLLRNISVLLKRIPGAIIALEPLRRAFSKSGRQIVVEDFDGGLKLHLCLNEHMQSQIFWHGYYSRDIVLLFNRLLRSGMVVIDVGANIGEITLAAARRVGANGAVYSFEPMPELFKTLKQNVEINGLPQVRLFEQALSDQAGLAKIYASSSLFGDGTRHDGLGTLYPSETRAKEVCEVKLQRLDEFRVERNIDRVDLIKIDVEGAEQAVVRGSVETIKNDRPYLVIEIQPETATSAGHASGEIRELLESLGYRLFVIGRKARLRPYRVSDTEKFHNVLCVPMEKKTP
jgi:FkbM family methyltransferase